MLKEQAIFFNRLIQALDIVLIVTAFFVAYFLRIPQTPSLNHPFEYIWILLIVLPLWHLLIRKYQLYNSIRTLSNVKIIGNLIRVHIIGGLFAAATIYLLHAQYFKRGLFLYFILCSLFFLTTAKLLIKVILSSLRRRGFNTRNLLVVGGKERSEKFIKLINEHDQWGFNVVARYSYSPVNPSSHEQSISSVDELVSCCKKKPIDEVIFCLHRNEIKNLDEYVHELDQLGITVRMVLDIYEVHRARREVSLFHGEVPVLTLHAMVFDQWQLFFKRSLDVVGSIVGITITALLFPFIAVAIKMDSPGPLLFGQKRVGYHGRLFTCWKFRSMYVDAEARKKELLEQNEMSGAMFKMKLDPRITPFGHFLRKTSLDELPQFWNVFKGDMSLVGTRPPTPDEVEIYENWHLRRISIKPGITGLWQVSGRNQVNEFDDVVRLDLQYIDQWSILLDIKILFQTIKVVFLREGSS